MATVSATVQRAFGFSKPAGPLASITKTTEQEIYCCYVHLVWASGTYAQADDADFNPATVIQNSMRNGKTVTVIGAAGAGHGDENGSIIHLGQPTSITANVVKGPLLQEDAATERGASAMSATWNRPVTAFVCFTQNID